MEMGNYIWYILKLQLKVKKKYSVSIIHKLFYLLTMSVFIFIKGRRICFHRPVSNVIVWL